MKFNFYQVILFFVVSIGVFNSCSKDDDVMYTISGTVVTDGSGMSGVTVAYAGGTAVTDAQGKFSFTVNENSNVTITPSFDGYTFDPSSIEIANITSDAKNQDFTASMVYDVNIDFQNVTFSGDIKYKENAGAGLDGIFTEGIVSFPNYYNTTYGSWSGFAYSQMHDITTEGYDNQYSVYVANEPENKFMVVFPSDPNDYSSKVSLTFGQPVKDLSFDVANATYAALSMKNGDTYAKKFTDSDWFELSVVAVTSDNTRKDPVTFKLGDGAKITDKWNSITIPYEGITKLEFSLSSTDTGDWGMNTHAYLCIYNIKARLVK